MAKNTSHSIGDYATQEAFETFSFLPPLTADEIYDQAAYIAAQGWTPAIEHEHPQNVMDHYWTMWKLPFFGEDDPDAILAEVDECRRAYPSHHIRLVGYDNYMQTQGLAFLVHRARS